MKEMALVYLDKDKVYKMIKKQVISLELKPGSIFTELEISSKLNFGKSPVREALKRLEQENFITAIPYKGYLVKEISRNYVIELLEMRKVLETHLSKVLAEKVKNGDTKVSQFISKILKEHERLAPRILRNQKGEEIGKIADIDFHLKLSRFYDNSIYQQILHRLLDQILRVINLSAQVPDRIKKSFEEHYNILLAIKKGTPDEAEKLTIAHIESVKLDILKKLLELEKVSESASRVYPFSIQARKRAMRRTLKVKP